VKSERFSLCILLNQVQEADAVGETFDHRVESEDVRIQLMLRHYMAAFVVSDDQYFDDKRADIHLEFGLLTSYL